MEIDPKTKCLDYDKLPEKIKELVDDALGKTHREIAFNVFEDGLISYDNPEDLSEILINERTEFMGIVYFRDENAYY